MEFKLAFFIFGLMHFKRCVASDNDCLDMMKQYPEQAKGFAEINATQKDLERAIDSITTNVNLTKAAIKSQLTYCFEIRKVK